MKFSIFIINAFLWFGILGAPVFAQSNSTDSSSRQQPLVQLEAAKQELLSLLVSQVRVLQAQLAELQAKQGEVSTGSVDTNTLSSLKIIYPNGGESLTKGKPYQLQWSSTGLSPNETVHLYLMDNNGKLQSLPIVRTINRGTHWFLISSNTPVGSYKLHIETLPFDVGVNSKVVSDTSDKTFEIVAAGGDASQGATSAPVTDNHDFGNRCIDIKNDQYTIASDQKPAPNVNIYWFLEYISPGQVITYMAGTNPFGQRLSDVPNLQAFQRANNLPESNYMDAASRAKIKQLTCGETDPGAKPEIKGIRPSSGIVDSGVFMLGTNLNAKKSEIYFNGKRITGNTLEENDGENTVRFKVPNLPPGKYPVVVKNSKGDSNTIFYTIDDTRPNSSLPGYCGEYYNGVDRPVPTDPAFKAHGFQKVEVPFKNVWGVEAGLSGGGSTGVPGNHLNPTEGRYLAIPFTVPYRGHVGLNWVELQGQSPGSFTSPVLISLSPCPGDFRKPAQTNISNSNPGNDRYMGWGCKLGSPGIHGSLRASETSCFAPPGKKMFINVATYDMTNSMNRNGGGPGTNLCDPRYDGAGCGVAVLLN